MSFALGAVPVALLLLGFPIFIVLLAAVSVALVFFMHMPFAALHFPVMFIPFRMIAPRLGGVAHRENRYDAGGCQCGENCHSAG